MKRIEQYSLNLCSCRNIAEHRFRKRFRLLMTIVSGSVGQLTHIAIIMCGCESGNLSWLLCSLSLDRPNRRHILVIAREESLQRDLIVAIENLQRFDSSIPSKFSLLRTLLVEKVGMNN